MNTDAFIEQALKVIEIEQKALDHLKACLDDQFIRACDLLLKCKGKVIIMGLGKSGHIGHKIAATMASTGTPSFFVHATEAAHGDLGMISKSDVVLALSNSGTTEELVAVLPGIKALKVPIISITNNPNSKLAQSADVNLNLNISEEACPLGLAPTASTTGTLVLGDAIAITLLVARGFKEEDYARSHPSGSLGKKLILDARALMVKADAIPQVNQNVTIDHAIVEISSKRLGMTTVVNDLGELIGIYTDGDIRRTIERRIDMYHTPISAVMSKKPRTIKCNTRAIDALSMMRQYKITALIVSNNQKNVDGVVHIHHILEAGIQD
jgi:arabinose-5-phosphate isomerase